jgi:hypothetical protein
MSCLCTVGTEDPIPCGDVTLYCPPVSLAPLPVPPGYYTAPAAGVVTNATNTMALRLDCPVGAYCVGGVLIQCPAGTFQGGTRKISLSDCRRCNAGGYCPLGSAAAVPCGPDTKYCPAGSAAPLDAGPGYYTEGVVGSRSSAVQCAPGTYCPGDGLAHDCPPGTFGAQPGLQDAGCSGQCNDGVLCEAQSVSAGGVPCPPGESCVATAAAAVSLCQLCAVRGCCGVCCARVCHVRMRVR